MTTRPAADALRPGRGVRATAYALVAALALAVLEAALAFLPSFAGAEFRSVVWFPPEITRRAFDDYLATRDPITGWPPREVAGERIVPRPSPASSGRGAPCVTTYGDSFVFGDEVADAAAWGDVLARMLGCAVANFGVGGFGTDQALLRFQANADDRAPATVLGIFADNPLRNVNQYRHLLSGAEPLGLKPRFVLKGGALRAIPLPASSYEEFTAGMRDPARLFRHEAFLPDTPLGPTDWRFPYTGSLARLLMNERVISHIRGRPSWIEFLAPDHASGALPTTVAIAEEFARVARARDKRVLVVLFPSLASYAMSRRGGASAYAGLVAALEARGLAVHDLTGDFAAHLGARSFCAILTQPARCYGHYGVEGNELVARAIQRRLAAVPGAGAVR